ncbi:nucleotidyltransferase family protein [Variovorax sp. J31P179]|uniref:nucleotidyltransferase family protein n=1 Tax=Variovorax sp. J31P179 TaxID=3053508 RepID=UPI0025770853|nr:nucleotidyltransferase family protein [Variovorax sp. J31P179]MDM0081851.1 nucleotidyltransferase family protein [Variovorax sp. J31P179]
MQDRFLADVLRNRHNRAILERWPALALPDGWLVAGCLFQTVWNLQAGRAPETAIKDYDLFYFDAGDTTAAGEQSVQARVDAVLGDIGVTVEASNQARVHLWYESHFGQPYAPLHSAKDGIDRFLVPATCVGIRPAELYAPNGLKLLYEGLLTMNPLTPHRELFERKAASYRARWPWLRIGPLGTDPPAPSAAGSCSGNPWSAADDSRGG